jgi:hypothetical protein
MDGAAEQAGELLQVVEIERAVLVGEEAGAAVVAALDDVGGDAGEGEAGAAGAWPASQRRSASAENASTVRPAALIRLRSVPFAIS